MKYLAVSAIIEEDVSIGEGTKVWYFTHIREHAKIGRDCTIGERSFIGEKAIIGDDCKLGNDVFIPNGVILKDKVFVGPKVVFTNVRKPKAWKKAKQYLDTLVEEGVSIGANATIVGGIKIAKEAIIAEGAVVIGDVEEGAMVAGNPARIVRKKQQLER